MEWEPLEDVVRWTRLTAELYADPTSRRVVVEEAPSHDGAPCFASYTADAKEHNRRPMFALVIYDVTPEAADPAHVREMALKLHTGTVRERIDRNSRHDHIFDRVEVVGLPCQPRRGAQAALTEADEQACVERCVAHHTAEIEARAGTGARDFFLPGTFNDDHERNILILTRRTPGWEGAVLHHMPETRAPYPAWHSGYYGFPSALYRDQPRLLYETDPWGGYLSVSWDKTDKLRAEEVQFPEEFTEGLLPEMLIRPEPMSSLGKELGTMRENISSISWYEDPPVRSRGRKAKAGRRKRKRTR